MPDNIWNADDTVRFLAWGSAAPNARDLWRQVRYEKHDIDPEDKKTKERWADGKFTDTERAILEESDNLYWKALNDLPGIIYSRKWTVTGRKKGSAKRETIPLIFFQSANIDPIGEDGGEAHPTLDIEGHKRAAIFTKGFDKESWVGLRFNAAEVRGAIQAKSSTTEEAAGTCTAELDDAETTVGQHQIGKPSLGRKPRKRDAATDANIKSKIQSVLLASKRQWPKPHNLPPTAYRAAQLLVSREPGNRLQGYSEVTVRKILAGTYEPMTRLGLSGRY